MAHRHFEGKKHSSAYLKYRVSPPMEVTEEILGFLEKKKGIPFDLAVDVGCGSGQGTVLLAPHFTQVVGTDISPAQLEVALANCKAPNISYRLCPAEELPFSDGGVHLVTSMNAAHWFDRPQFLQGGRQGVEAQWVSGTGQLCCRQHSQDLSDICQKFFKTLLPFRSAHLGLSSTAPLYRKMYNSCPYPDKEWHECDVRRPMPLCDYIGMVETLSSYQVLSKEEPVKAHSFSLEFQKRLFSVMGVSSPEIEVIVVIKYLYWLASKPAAT
ncbi:uncharacterized protein LOC105023182 [Esox lucius]|uniref:Methyltransferase type 11 domain-containing protein n=1 Tax=Esox lucius TaxID=8010 RepID=A0AAY5L1G2_ESOLU|nr:uncharacterized protein LOC105023182 [Esox lucius]